MLTLLTPKRVGIVVILALHMAMLGWSSTCHSALSDEVAHLVAGLSNWDLGRFRLYSVNPPLVRMIAAIPVAIAGPNVDWRAYDVTQNQRAEWIAARDFIGANTARWFVYLISARLMCALLSLVAAWICYSWARQLYGGASGIFAMILWTMSPTALAWSSVVTTDAGAATFGVLAAYLYWQWLRDPRWAQVLTAGTALGFAQLSKFTWLILFVLWPLVWMSPALLSTSRINAVVYLRRTAMQFAAILALAIVVMNLGYCFEGTGKPLRTFSEYWRRIHAPGTGLASQSDSERSWNSAIPVPIPENYLRGIALQSVDFKWGIPSYLNGAWTDRGRWYYYLEALCLKEPLGNWLIVVLASATHFLRVRACSGRTSHASGMHITIVAGAPHAQCDWRDTMLLLAPCVTIVTIASANTGVCGFRYILPAYPFLFVWMSRVVSPTVLTGWLDGRRERDALRRADDLRAAPACGGGKWRGKVISGIACACIGWSIISTLLIVPDFLSYFNEIAGGPTHGHKYLIDDCADWGQDILYLKKWYKTHAAPRTLYAELSTFVDPQLYGLDTSSTPLRDLCVAGGCHSDEPEGRSSSRLCALSVSRLHSRDRRFEHLLRQHRPIAVAGWSIYIYDLPGDYY